MRNPPAPLARGPKWLCAWLNALLTFVIQTRPLESELCALDEKLDGTQILPRAVSGTGTAAAARRLFQIYDASTRDGAGAITAAKVRLVSSLLAQDVPTTGISAGITVATGDVIFGRVAFSTSTGAVTSRTIVAGSTLPPDEEGISYCRIGSVVIAGDVLTPTNDIYGPIDGCRDWFSEPLTYTLTGSP